ncbi:FG-GAP repeat domain-containing protein [Novipirellula artificiosorum]|uniref:FG-GAP repeat protein n=1 Tax=Novipirellula artificiosorum TaxID=2528016 RepID=A0A5C6E2U0_9BACT|nr:VCBS repeat-containing protein [Novipirellula artificiosorum]TWU41931.1 FG-GAP repeat protein [Novipirellula artificiosorum]
MQTNPGIYFLSLLLTAVASLGLAGEPTWVRRSSNTGDLAAPNAGSQQTCCVVADLDGDGMDDFVVGERTKTPSIVWYKNRGQSWDKFVIDDQPRKPEAGGVCFDIDGDGDQDLVFGQDSSGSEIWWWENPCPDFTKPWLRRLIKQDGARQYHDQTAGDFDGDGKIEFVTWNQRAKQLLMFEVPEDPRSAGPWPSTVIFQWDQGPPAEGFPSIPVDIDSDGQIDIVGGGRWFKYQGGGKFDPHVIDDKMRFTQCAAGQLVAGGRPEVVFSPGDADGDAKWYEWKDGKWVAHSLGFVIHGHTCEVRDVNGDGNPDIFIGEMGSPGAGDKAKAFVWYGDSQGEFRKTIVSEGQGIHEGLLSDLDGDGDLDILMKPYHHNSPRIDILLNTP